LELFDCGRTLNVVLGFRSLRADIGLVGDLLQILPEIERLMTPGG